MASTEEITELIAIYGENCSVLENRGDFRYVVTVSFRQPLPVVIQFRLNENYPATLPEITVEPGAVSDSEQETLFPKDSRDDLQYHLTTMAEESFAGKPMLKELLENGVCWMTAYFDYGQKKSDSNGLTDTKSGNRKQLATKKTLREPVKPVAVQLSSVQSAELSPVTSSSDEVAELITQYGSLCKVMENQGIFRYIVTVTIGRPTPVRIQLALDENYPSTLPEVVVKPGSTGHLHSDVWFPLSKRECLRKSILTMAGQRPDRPSLKQLLEHAVEWLTTYYNDEKTNIDSTSHTEKNNENVKKQDTKTQEMINSASSVQFMPEVGGKLPAMRTSEDVISRIMWDDKLKRSCVTVGYLDRFAGLIEEKFSSFCWDQPISAVDNDTLAIPRHRIQFFKYNGVKIWDKNERLDLVFGSAGSDVNFYEFIAQFPSTTEETQKEVEPEAEEDVDFDFDELQDSLGPTKRFQNPNRPNFFVGVRMNDSEIVKKTEEITDQIVNKQPMFQSCILPSKCLHVTLATVRLNGLNEITNAISVLREMKNDLQKTFPKPIFLTVEKLDTFYQNVLFAKVRDSQFSSNQFSSGQFMQLAEMVRNGLEKGNVKLFDVHNFVPHMTIMKINRPTQRQFSVPRTIDWTLYHDFKEAYFGVQKVETLFLCPIGVDRREDGFYQSVLEMNI